MSVKKFSISTSQELFDALEALRDRHSRDRSSLVEMLLREHPAVRHEIRRSRQQARAPETKRGRDRETIRTLGRVAGRRWESQEASDEVAFLDR